MQMGVIPNKAGNLGNTYFFVVVFTPSQNIFELLF